MKLGSSKRKGSTQLKTSAPNNEWFKNVIKSVGYTTADIVKETIPATFEFIDSNGKEAIQLYNDLRQEGSTSVGKMIADVVSKNQYSQLANEAIQNMKDDLKSGNLYNREREEKAILGDDADFDFGGDLDFSFDDEDLNDDGYELETEGDSELSDINQDKKVVINNINANITKNNPMVQSIEKQSEVILAAADATNKINTNLAVTNYSMMSKSTSDMITGLATINDNLTALVNFNNDSMSKYVAASLQYYSDSLTVLNNTLEHMKGGNNDSEIDKTKEIIDPFLSNGALDIRQYAKLFKSNISNVIQDDLMLNSLYSFASDTDTLKMLVASPLQAIPKMLVKKVIPAMVQNAASEFDKTFTNFFPALLNRFNKMADSDNWFLSKIGQLFGYKPKTKSNVDISLYNKNDMNFNGITQKAITEVIPTYLRKILSALTGGTEKLFDYNTGKFVDYMTAFEDRNTEIRNKSINSMDTYSELKSRLDAIQFTDKETKETMMRDFDNFMYKLSKSNGINPYVRQVKGETVDELKDLYSGQFTELFRGALLSLNKADLMKLMGADIFESKNVMTKYFKDAEERSELSLDSSLDAWESKNDYEKKGKEYKAKYRVDALTIDKFGKSSIDYTKDIRDLLLQGIVVYNATRGSKGLYRSKSKSKPSVDIELHRERLERLSKEKTPLQDTISKANVIPPYREFTEEKRKTLQKQGVVVADSVSELVSDKSTEQLTDIFKNFAEIRDSEDTAAKQMTSAGGWLRKIFSKGAKDVNSIGDVVSNIIETPARVVSNVFKELDNGLYRLIFGVNKDGSEQSFINKVFTSIKTEFTGFFDWTKEKFFDPIHESLLGEDGLLTKAKNSKAMESIRNAGRKMADWAFGEEDDNGFRRNGAFADAFNDVKDLTNEVKRTFTGKGYVDRFGDTVADTNNSVFGNVNGVMSNLYQNGKLYLFGNKKDEYTTKQMLIPTAFDVGYRENQSVPIIDPIQNLYTPEAAEKAKKPIVELEKPKDPFKVEPASPFLQSYIDNRNSVISTINKNLNNNNNTTTTTTNNSNTNVNNQMQSDKNDGNGGFNIFDKFKEMLKLQYSIDINDQKGEPKTISVGENVESSIGSGGFAPIMVNGFPYFSQRDPRYANTPYNLSTGKGGGSDITFGDRGCGPTAMSMIANGLGYDINPLEMGDIATETGYSVDGGTKGSFFKSIGDKLGLNAKEKQTSVSQVESALMQGKPMIFRGRKTTTKATPFTTDGHFVVGVGGKDGKVQINDPNGVETSGEYNIDDIVSESNKMWTFDDTGKGPAVNVKQPSYMSQASTPAYRIQDTKVLKDKYITDWSIRASADGSGQIDGAVTELATGFREASADLLSLVFGEKAGDEDKESRVKKFGNKFREMLPKGIAGSILGGGLGAIVGATGGMGLIGSFFLPGGPIGGAILGTALGLVTQTDKFKDWLFGKEDPEDSSKRVGGFISQKTQDFFKKHKTTIIGGAALGGLKGIIGGTGVIGSMLFGGPITGALMGAGIGLAVRSEKFQETVFGKLDEESGKKIGGLLSNSYNKVVDNKKLIAGAGAGALGGLGIGALMSSMGILGSAFFLGPVGGAIAGAGLGIAVASEKWRDKVFGKFNDEKGKREGGLMDEVKTAIKYEILAPLKEKMAETTLDLKYWFDKAIMLPISNAFEPFKKLTGMIGEEIMYNFKAITTRIGDGFNKYIGEPVQSFLHDKVFNPMQKAMSTLFDTTMKVTKTILGAPFKLLDGVSWLGARMVQNKAQKRLNKFNKADKRLTALDDIASERELTEKEQKRYAKLQRRRERFQIDKDDERLTFFDTWKERRDAKLEDIKKEEKAKKAAFARLKDYNRERREFAKIFGEDVKFDAQLLQDYKSIAERENGKKIKGRKNRKAVREQQENFLKQFHENRANAKGGAEIVAPDISKIKDQLSDNLSPIRGSLYKIENILTKWFKKLGGGFGDDKDSAKGGTPSITRPIIQKVKVKDTPRMTLGKGDDKKDDSKDTKLATDKNTENNKKGFFSSLTESVTAAFRKFDKINDKEEEAKANAKETKAILAEKQKAVSTKSYVNLSNALKEKAKEEEERTFKDKLLAAVEGIKTTTAEHKIGWDDIFSKKGLLTGALLLALPAFAAFLANPAKAISDLMSSLLNKITISIGWLFGKNNGQRTDATGEQVLNTGLIDSTARAARNGVAKVAKTEVGQKAFRVGAEVVEKVLKTTNPISEGAKEIVKAGFKGADDLVELGIRNADDLLEMGISSANDLKYIGIKNADDLSKVGIRTVDDLAKVGVNINSKRQVKKAGVKNVKEFVETGIISSPVKQVTETGATIIQNANQSMFNKFKTTIFDWLDKAFTNAKVVKKLGADVAKNTLATLKDKLAKTLTGTVLEKYAKSISVALAEVAGRVAAGTTTGGIVTAAFGVVDFVSGAVNAERLFEIPPGTATLGMRTMSAVLQTILGIGMVGPIIDVVNEIMAEVTGFNFLSMIATIGYSFLTESTGGAIELKNLQAEFDEDYEMYLEANGLENFSKRAYQDVVNPSFGTKVANKAKKFGNAVTGNFFDSDEIRYTLGKDKDYKVTLTDRISELMGNIAQGVTFGRVNGDELTRNASTMFNNVKGWASDKLDGAKAWVSDKWNGAKDWVSDNWNGAKIWASNAWDNTKNKAKDIWANTKEFASNAWETTKNTAKNVGHGMTFGVFDDNTIRKELGLNEDVKVTLRDRAAMGISNAIEALSFGNIDSKDTIHAIVGIQNTIMDNAKELWGNVKTTFTDIGQNIKNEWSNLWTGVGKKITGALGLFDDNGEPLTFTEGFVQIKDSVIESIKTGVSEFKERAVQTWGWIKFSANEKWQNFKDQWNTAWTSTGKKITGALGLFDDNGEPLTFTEGFAKVKDTIMNNIKSGVTTFKTKAKETWTEFKDGASKKWQTFKGLWSNAWTSAGKKITGALGLFDDNGEAIPLTEAVSKTKDSVISSIKGSVNKLKDDALSFWNGTKDMLSKGWKKIKDAVSGAFDKVDNFFGSLFGFTDENGNDIGLVDGVKQGWNNLKENVNDFWSRMTNRGKQEVSRRNSGNGGYGGFGAEPMPMTNNYGGFGPEAIPMNIGARGCGPTAMAMVTSKISGTPVDPVTMSNLATNAGFAGDYGTNGKYFTYAANKFGIQASEGRTTTDNLSRALDSGQPVILRGQSNGESGSAFTRSGHYVVAVGKKDDKVIINDPRGVNYSGAYDMKDVVSQSNIMWSFGNAQGPYGVDLPPLVLGGASGDGVPGELIYKYAAVHVGKPYVWGANGPDSFDCSGLVNLAAKQAGVKLPSSRPTAAVWRKHCKTIKKEELRVGDLGFYRQGGSITHVAIYAGDGKWCHAEGGSGPKGQGGKVKISSPTYLNEFGRIPGVTASSTQYVGNSVRINEGGPRTGGILGNITGFISSLGEAAINSAITGNAPEFMTFSEYMANSNSGNTSTGGSTYNGEVVSLGSRKTDAATLNRFLGGKLSNKGDVIMRYGKQYGVDPALVASILHHESANGTSNAIVNYNNPGGIMDPNTNWSKLKRFPTLDAGIEYTTSNLKRNYIDQGLDTIPEIGNKYAPVGAANDPRGLNKNWVPNISKLYNQYSYEGMGGFGEVELNTGTVPTFETSNNKSSNYLNTIKNIIRKPEIAKSNEPVVTNVGGFGEVEVNADVRPTFETNSYKSSNYLNTIKNIIRKPEIAKSNEPVVTNVGGFGGTTVSEDSIVINNHNSSDYDKFIINDELPTRQSYTFKDRLSNIGMGATYIKTMVQDQLGNRANDVDMVGIMDRVLQVLTTIADNTGITNKNIRDAITNVMTSTTSNTTTTVNNINGSSKVTSENRTLRSTYTDTEMKNRDIAQKIAQGIFV